MSDIQKVKELRESTGAGFKDCNLAIKESNGDLEKAVEILRVKGISKASKKMSRDAKEGVVATSGDEDKTSVVELNCETDFVAKSDEFKNVAKQVAMHIAALKPEFLNIEDIPTDRINEEKDIIKKQSENEGKPQDVISKIVEGKVASFYKDYVLNEQTFCNPEFYEGQVGTMIDELSGRLGEKIYIKTFSRIEVGS